jgi:hypothetical protein
VGDVMKRFGVLLVALLGLPPIASADEPNVFKAGAEAEILLSTVAELTVATELCAVGDRQDWQRVVQAVDRRYRFCAGKHAAWSRLLGDFEEDEKRSTAQGSSRSFGSFAVDSFVKSRGAEARAMGAQVYCAKLPWKLLLVPGAATPEARAEYLKTNPTGALDNALAFFGYVRNLGVDTAWVEAPCDKDFWPPFAGNKR